jgi:hypothetical protein
LVDDVDLLLMPLREGEREMLSVPPCKKWGGETDMGMGHGGWGAMLKPKAKCGRIDGSNEGEWGMEGRKRHLSIWKMEIAENDMEGQNAKREC